MDEFGTARRTAIVRAFIDALTRGGTIVIPVGEVNHRFNRTYCTCTLFYNSRCI